MSRKPGDLRWSEEACCHIFNRGHNREVVFRHNYDRRYILDLCRLSAIALRFGLITIT